MNRMKCSGCGCKGYDLWLNDAGGFILVCQSCGARSHLEVVSEIGFTTPQNDTNCGRPIPTGESE